MTENELRSWVKTRGVYAIKDELCISLIKSISSLCGEDVTHTGGYYQHKREDKVKEFMTIQDDIKLIDKIIEEMT